MTINLVTDRPVHTDLINNFQKFHEFNTEEDLLVTQDKWLDDSNYYNYRTIEDLFENIKPEDFFCSHVVSVDIKDIWSSEETLGGCDRPLWSIQAPTAIAKQEENLNRHSMYRSGAAGIMSGMLRPDPKNPGSWQLVKYIGNNRVAMKLRARNGEPSRVLMSVTFHETGKEHKEYIVIESELHATDAGDRSGQNERQKFVSGFRADREDEKYTYSFLRKHQYNYGTIMQQEGNEDSEDWLTITSLQGIKTGRGNGYFKKYGEINVSRAFETVKEICKITEETAVGSTPIECISLMYYVYTEHGKKNENSIPIFTHEELHNFFVAYFKKFSKGDDVFDQDPVKIKALAQTGALKDIAYICARQFWPFIQKYWRNIKDQKYAFSSDCHANKILVELCSDVRLKKEINAIIS